MQLAVRIFAGITSALLMVGALFFVVVVFLASNIACMDACYLITPDQSLGDIAGLALGLAYVALGPGFLFALATWGLFVVALVRSRGQWPLAIVGGGAPCFPVGVYILVAAFVPPAALLPTTNGEYIAWMWKLVLTCLVTLGVVVAMLVLAPSPTEADKRAADFASLRGAQQDREAKGQQWQAAQQRQPHADGSEIARLTAELAMLRSNEQAWDRYCRARWPQRYAQTFGSQSAR
jgi:hypothetical protein